jgi:hypothetical protein
MSIGRTKAFISVHILNVRFFTADTLPTNSTSYFLNNKIKKIFNSTVAIFFLGNFSSPPKGIEVFLTILTLVSFKNLSGINSSGVSQNSGDLRINS